MAGSKRCTIRGQVFDSLAEAGYYTELLDREQKGEISEIILQPSWRLEAWGQEEQAPVDIGKYTADFSYYDRVTNKTMVIDIKGQVPKTIVMKNGRKKRVSGGKGWTAFRMRCKILQANYGVVVEVIEGKEYTILARLAGAREL